MKLTNYLINMITVIFVAGVLTSSYAGQKAVVVSPKADKSKVVPKATKQQRAPGVPGAEKAKPGIPKGKPKKMEYNPKKNWPQVMCQGKVPTRIGTSGDDTPYNNPDMYGSLADDVIYGAGGHDTIRGEGGNDTICGGPGGDTLYGGVGADIIDGGPGYDRCYVDDYDDWSNCEIVIKQ